MKYKTEKDLKEIYIYMDEADLALKDKTRTLKDSDIASVIEKSAVNSGILASGVAASGVLTPLVPIVLIGITGGIIGHLIKKKSEEEKIRKAKELAYNEAIAKQNALIKALKEESNADKDRIEYLVGLNQLLQEEIFELQKELEQYSKEV